MTDRGGQAGQTRRPCVLALLLLWCTAAVAVPTERSKGAVPDASVHQYLRDLAGEDRNRRTYAARVLLRRTRLARRMAGRSRGDRLEIDAARQTLMDFDAVVAPRCIEQLHVIGLTRPCVIMLELLETSAAVPALKTQRTKEVRKGMKRRIDRALIVIRAASEPQ
jgi:hypothetical protein